MAHQSITTTPTALSGIQTGIVYTVQFRSSGKTFVATSATAPTDSTGVFIVGTNGVVTVKKTAAESVWVWGESAGGIAVYEVAP